MKFRQVAQRIENLDRAIAFYNQILNLEPIAVFNPPGFAFYNLDGVRLSLDINAPTSLIYLQVDDVETKVAELRAIGIKVLNEPHVVFPDEGGIFDTPGDEWLAFVEDSEGNQLGLMSRKPSGA
jgi:methylmalonyl-CoA/ethylmalonyl-CoA epimerase